MMDQPIDGFSIFVPGRPQTKGSAKAFARLGKNGKPFASIVNDNAKAKSWEALIRDSIRLQVPKDRLRLDRPCFVEIVAQFLRPAKHRRAGRFASELRSDAPFRMAVKPDIDKVVRSVLDALTGVAYLDDSAVYRVDAIKRWAGPHVEPEGVKIAVRYEAGLFPQAEASP